MRTCQKCQTHDAVVQLTKVTGTEVTTIHLCSRCAAESGVEVKVEIGGNSPLGGFLGALTENLGSRGPEGEQTTQCPRCGATLVEVRAKGRLGCADCWSTFEEPLGRLLTRLHGSRQHSGEWYSPPGSLDQKAEERHRMLLERRALEASLRSAVQQEAFEHAATLRDAIRQLEQTSSDE